MTITTTRRPALFLLLLLGVASLRAHEVAPVTHAFGSTTTPAGPRLRLSVTDEATGRPLAARFSLVVDGRTFVPEWIDEHGIRFTSIHRTKRQEFTALYSRGGGPVLVALPPGAREVQVTATRGFEYLPAVVTGRIEQDRVAISVPLRRWIDLEAGGWISVDEHVHYDRLDRSTNSTWLAMLEADGLTAAHFLVLKGGMMPGVWARQYAYGPAGEASNGRQIIVPGQEYRDSAQGHVNLLGIDRVLEPISTGGMGTPATPENFPPLHDVLREARAASGLTGVAHAGRLGRAPTAVADVVLGTVDFWELSNGFIYGTELWYRLLNGGFFLPPLAGTDLPNSPFREPWQPMLGAVRTYVHTGGRIDFRSFKSALARGRVFITGGPLLRLSVGESGPGDTVALPAGGGSLRVRVEAASPRPLRSLHLVHNGRQVPAKVGASTDGAIHRLTIDHEITFTDSGWIAAEARGERIATQDCDALAHTAAVRVLVGGSPVRSAEDLGHLLELVTQQRAHYLREGRYRSEADRAHVADVFSRAMATLRQRLEGAR